MATLSDPLIMAHPPLDHLDKHGYLFGLKLAASVAPDLHGAVYEQLGLNWGLLRLDSADMDLFLERIRDDRFFGAAVTMPHKVAILPHLDELEPECRAVGACNTIFLRTHPTTGRRLLCGANTDVVGVRDAFLHNVADPAALAGRPGLVIGGGGAARSAVYALQRYLGVRTVYLVNRDPAEVEAVIADCQASGLELVHVASVAQAQAQPAPGAVVACIPDLPPQTADEVRARQITEAFLAKDAKGAMLEMCYNPSLHTALGALATSHGWQVILGTEAVIYQGLEQNRYWTGRPLSALPVQEAKEAVAQLLAQRKDASRL